MSALLESCEDPNLLRQKTPRPLVEEPARVVGPFVGPRISRARLAEKRLLRGRTGGPAIGIDLDVAGKDRPMTGNAPCPSRRPELVLAGAVVLSHADGPGVLNGNVPRVATGTRSCWPSSSAGAPDRSSLRLSTATPERLDRPGHQMLADPARHRRRNNTTTNHIRCQGRRGIALTRPPAGALRRRPRFDRTIEETPDTVMPLTNGSKRVVEEAIDEISESTELLKAAAWP